jgi:hypothetical protein
MRSSKRRLALAVLVTGIAVGTAVGVSLSTGPGKAQSLKAPHFRSFDRDAFQTSLGKVSNGGEPESIDGRAQEIYDNQAYPAKAIDVARQRAAASAARAIGRLSPAKKAVGWHELGPSGVPASALVASESTGASAGTVFSGRATAIAVDPNCTAKKCPMFIGAAGGGVWKTDKATAKKPKWKPVGDAIGSNAIGSIAFDPNDLTGQTLYVGTGEPNGSGDSEAGIGLYKSTDGGQTWTLVAGSTAGTAPCADNPSSLTCPVATGNSIGSIAIDPVDPDHIFIGTDVARHGSSSSNGGRFTPPGGAQVGLYESTDGGASFTPVLILTQDVVDPTTATGSNFFRGGVSNVQLYRASGETQVYASAFDYGLYRRSNALDGDTAFHQIFNALGGGTAGNSSSARTEFSLAPNGSPLRIYVGDAGLGGAEFWRVDDANVTAATLLTGGTNGGWTKLSDSTNGTSGFGSYNYCTGQCSYDMPVYSPPGFPDVVYIGGAMKYDEIFPDATPDRSNGRAIQRSENAGVDFTDMTIDTKGVSLHPDQHAIAGTPFSPNVLFIGNDGGIWRLNGSFSNASGDCAGRGLAGDDLTDCTDWLSKVPTTISSLNAGLGTLQFQSLSANPSKPKDLMGGTQDNGTQANNGKAKWFVTIFGDGGQSGINPFNANKRFHTFFDAQIDMNFHGTNPLGWDWVSDTFFGGGAGAAEGRSFYIPIIVDPTVDETLFTGLQHVWRTQDDNGGQAFLDSNCNEFFGSFASPCGDWAAIGDDLSGTGFGTDKNPGSSGYVVAVERAPSDDGTLWAGLRRGRVFVTSNADDSTPANVTFYRIDDATTPERFVSGIAIDPTDPNHAFLSFSGYNAYATAAGTATGHVFDVTYNPGTHTATWTNNDNNLGDEPITDVALDSATGDLYVSTDFGVDVLKSGSSTWVTSAPGLPPVAVYGLTYNGLGTGTLFAATHGRGAWELKLTSP